MAELFNIRLGAPTISEVEDRKSKSKPKTKKAGKGDGEDGRPLLQKKDMVVLRFLGLKIAASSLPVIAKDLQMYKSTMYTRLKRLKAWGYAEQEIVSRKWYRTEEGQKMVEKLDALEEPSPMKKEDLRLLSRLNTDTVSTLRNLAEEFNVDTGIIRKRLQRLQVSLAVTQDVNLGWYKTKSGEALEKALKQKGLTSTDAPAAE
jgi:DNA-binding MarR family transcriptional regulator